MEAPWHAALLLAERCAQPRGAACPGAKSSASLFLRGLPFGGLLTPAAWLTEQHLCEVESVCERRGWGTEPWLDPEAALSEPADALWVQGAFLGAVAALQGKQWQLEGALRVCLAQS